NGCDPASELLAEVVPAGVRVLSYGVPASRGEPALALDVSAEAAPPTRDGTRIRLVWQNALAHAVGEAPDALVIRAVGDGSAASVADRVVLTADNPRDEEPGEIAAAIRRGVRAGVATAVELDRAKAIALALDGAGERDVVVVAGKGHETEQTAGGGARAFSD